MQKKREMGTELTEIAGFLFLTPYCAAGDTWPLCPVQVYIRVDSLHRDIEGRDVSHLMTIETHVRIIHALFDQLTWDGKSYDLMTQFPVHLGGFN